MTESEFGEWRGIVKELTLELLLEGGEGRTAWAADEG